ncbi:4434_t:CDS:2, partial [Acaulospora colombiana]
KQDSQAQLKGLRKNVQSARDIMQLEELKCRKRVLRRMGFASSDDVVEMKGRVACEISSGDELLLTEMIFEGIFNALSPEHEKQIKMTAELAGPLASMQNIARRIAQISKESKLELVEDQYVAQFKVELMDALTDQYEGTIIRTFRRLQELLRQMTAAAKAIGNNELEKKFIDALALLERQNS